MKAAFSCWLLVIVGVLIVSTPDGNSLLACDSGTPEPAKSSSKLKR